VNYKEALSYILLTGGIVIIEEWDTLLTFNDSKQKFQTARRIRTEEETIITEFQDCYSDAWGGRTFEKFEESFIIRR
jgi:hypothetical protein